MTDEKITQCIKFIEQTTQDKNNSEENKKKLKKNDLFFENYLILEKNLVKLSLIKQNNFDFKISQETTQKLKILLKYIKIAFDNRLVSKTINYKEDINYLNNQLSIEWSLYIAEYIKNTKENLEILSLVSDNKYNLNKIIRILENFSDWNRLSYESITIFLENYQLAQEELKNMKFNNEISIFLKKIKTKQATLKDLINNNEVLSWIKEENLLDKLILTIK